MSRSTSAGVSANNVDVAARDPSGWRGGAVVLLFPLVGFVGLAAVVEAGACFVGNGNVAALIGDVSAVAALLWLMRRLAGPAALPSGVSPARS